MPNLPLTSTHWGTYRVETHDGRVTALHPFEQDDDPSPIGPGIVATLNGPGRITTPCIRQSWLENGPGASTDKRGAEPFVAVDWPTAEALVADELHRVSTQFGNRAIYAGSYGWASAGRFHHAQSQIHRFLNCIGGYTRSRDTYSFAAAEVLLPHILGNLYVFLAYATSWPSLCEHTDLLVAFGGMPLKNGQINSGGIGRHTQRENLKKAVAAGVEIVNISPINADVEAFAGPRWLAARPGTDVALMLALAHTLYTENLHNQAFLDRYTYGFAQFKAYLVGESDGIAKDAGWASRICALPADTITGLARQMAAGRTMLSLSWSLTRQHHGEQPFWAGLALAAMLGQIGLPGGGIGFGYSATNSVGDHSARIPGAALPQGENPVPDFIPVARISDMLLHPGATFDYNGERHTYPDIHLIYWAGGNPFHHHQDLNRLLRAWRKPDTVIIHDWCWNSAAKHADIVLPCTTHLERNDLALSPRDPYIIAMRQAQQPPGGARNDYDILRRIARRLGVEEAFTEGRDEAAWLEWLYHRTRDNAAKRDIPLPEYHDLLNRGWFVPPAPPQPTVLLESFRRDPEANPLKTQSGKIEIFCPTIAGFNYPDCRGHPIWQEPVEWLGMANPKYPLHLISNQPKTRLHSQLDHGDYSRKAKIRGREPIALNRGEALKRGLVAGDIVRIYNARGACLAGVVVDDNIMDGVVQISTGAWYDPLQPGQPGSLCKHGNPNVLTPDRATSRLAQGPIAHTCMVELEKFNGQLPPITAFDAPQILSLDPNADHRD